MCMNVPRGGGGQVVEDIDELAIPASWKERAAALLEKYSLLNTEDVHGALLKVKGHAGHAKAVCLKLQRAKLEKKADEYESEEEKHVAEVSDGLETKVVADELEFVKNNHVTAAPSDRIRVVSILLCLTRGVRAFRVFFKQLSSQASTTASSRTGTPPRATCRWMRQWGGGAARSLAWR